MKVVSFRKIEDCFDGSFIKEALLDGPLTESLIRCLAREAELDYYSDFPRPFYTIRKKEKFTIKGVEGDPVVRVVLYRRNAAEAEAELLALFACCENHA